MINWYDIQVEQKIAQERYQTIIQARQVSRPLIKRTHNKSERWGWVWFGCKLQNLGISFRRLQKSTSPQC